MSLFRRFLTGEDQPLLDDPQLIDTLYKRHRLRIMLAITIGYGIVYTCRLALSMVKKPLIDGGIFTPVELGIIGSALFYTYAFGKLTNGFLADHMNLKFFFAFGVLVSALINIGMGFSTILWLSVLLWGLNGWFQGFGAPSGAVAMANWFSNSERGRMYGIWSTAHAIGEGLTFVGVAALVTLWGWRAGFWGPGVLCVVVAGVLYLMMQDRPQTFGLPRAAVWKNDFVSSDEGSEEKKKSTWAVQKTILKIPAIWVLALASASIYVTRYAINSWGVLYLQEAKGYTLMQAGAVISVNTIAGILGAVAFGFASDKIFNARRPPTNVIFAFLEIIGLLMVFFGPPGKPVFMTVAFFIYGFGLTGLVTSLGGLFALDIAPKRAAGAAMGFIGVFLLHRCRSPGSDQRASDRRGHHHDRRSSALRLFKRDLVLDRIVCRFIHPRHLVVAGAGSGLRRVMTENTKTFDVATLGNYTKDTIVTAAGTHHADGGGVNYSAHAALALGRKVAAVMRLSAEDFHVVRALEEAGITVFATATPSSTLMRLEYPTDNPDERILTVADTAGAFTPEQVRDIDAKAFIISPSIRGEFPVETIRELRKKDALISADAQGFIRVRRSDGRLEHLPWPEQARGAGHDRRPQGRHRRGRGTDRRGRHEGCGPGACGPGAPRDRDHPPRRNRGAGRR